MALPPTTPMSRSCKVLHLEPTDVCNLACPLCARETDTNFTQHKQNHLTVEQVYSAVGHEFIQNLDKMFMCGNYGDPAAGQHTVRIYEYFRSINPTITLGMNTNGSLRTTNYWQELGEDILNQPLDYVVFSIDGLADTNHIYRRGAVWDKIVENAEAFIKAGGSAHWDMLVYQHNQHQVESAEQLAKSLGFKWFRAKVSKRPYINGLEFPIGWQSPVQESGAIDCIALKEQSVYIDAQGRTSPCCWLGSTQTDFVTMKQVQATWNSNPHPVCRATCSTNNNSFVNQWQRVVELC